MPFEPETITLSNICRGAVEEVFQKEIEKLLENIRDPNTKDDAKRTVLLTFSFKPYPDRSGAVVEFAVKTTLQNIKPVGGTIHISTAGGESKAYPRDPRQQVMFDPAAVRGGTQ
jgi:hypothetical protein